MFRGLILSASADNDENMSMRKKQRFAHREGNDKRTLVGKVDAAA